MMRDPETTRVIGRRPPFARWLSTLAGVWLFVSAAWIWRMPTSARENAVIVGICIAAVAFVATFMPAIRFLNTLLAAWLLVSTALVFRDVRGVAAWNAIVVGVVVLIASIPRDYKARPDQQYVRRWARHRAR